MKRYLPRFITPVAALLGVALLLVGIFSLTNVSTVSADCRNGGSIATPTRDCRDRDDLRDHAPITSTVPVAFVVNCLNANVWANVPNGTPAVFTTSLGQSISYIISGYAQSSMPLGYTGTVSVVVGGGLGNLQYQNGYGYGSSTSQLAALGYPVVTGVYGYNALNAQSALTSVSCAPVPAPVVAPVVQATPAPQVVYVQAPAQAPAVVSARPITTSAIRPPNTGDGGLR